jgi:hypothetical protein
MEIWIKVFVQRELSYGDLHQSLRPAGTMLQRCNGVVKYVWLGLPGGHVRCPAPGNRQPYIDIATET